MGRVDDLIAFVRARLDEDEAAARAAASVAGPDWTWDRESRDGYLRTPDGTIMADALNAEDEEFRPHVARHDPARALRDVAADRALLAEAGRIAQSASMYPNQGNAAALIAMQAVLKIRAERFSDHQDYRPGWKP